MEPGVLELCERSLPVFQALGMEVIDHPRLPTATSFAGTADLWPMFLVYRHWLIGSQLNAVYRNPKLRAALKPEAIYEIEGLFTAPTAIRRSPHSMSTTPRSSGRPCTMRSESCSHRSGLSRCRRPRFSRSTPISIGRTRINGVTMSSYHRWMEVTAIGTLLGYPVISLPVGFSDEGLPMGIQVIAANHQDLALLQLARLWEQETRWVQDHPPALLG